MEVRHRELRRHSIEEKDEHTLSEKYESLDYEIVENDLYRKAEKDVDHQVIYERKNVTFGSFDFPEKIISQSNRPLDYLFSNWRLHCLRGCNH
jgi:hypothetical protein